MRIFRHFQQYFSYTLVSSFIVEKTECLTKNTNRLQVTDKLSQNVVCSKHHHGQELNSQL